MAGEYAWRRGRIAAFLILTFALSWGYDAAIAVSIGHSAWLELGMAPWSMFVPALVALSLQLFAYPDSPLYVRRGWDRAHLIPISYLALALLYGVVTLLVLEVGFRLAHVSVGTVQINRATVRPSANPRLRFELTPGSAVR